MRAVVSPVEFEIGIGPQALNHLNVFTHPRIAFGITDPSAVAE
jgi:hypothetical protein